MEELQEAIDAGDAEYTEFTGRFAEVSLTVEYEGWIVGARMEMDGEYPLMRLERAERRD
jgi:dihydroneopterin aldolase